MHKRSGQEVHGNYINGFFEKRHLGKWTILGRKMAYGHNFGAALKDFF